MKHEIEPSTFQIVVQLSAYSSRTQRNYLCKCSTNCMSSYGSVNVLIHR